jgi:hypothetical protein
MPAEAGLTLFAAPSDEHSNAALTDPPNEDMEGWQEPGGYWPIIAANVSGEPIRPHPELELLDPSELYVHPGNGFTPQASAVVRWTAPYSSTFSLAVIWRDIDWNCGDGFGAHVVVNGTSIYDANPGNGGNTSFTTTLSLVGGDVVDFVVDPGLAGDQGCDATALRVTINDVGQPTPTPTPTPTSTATFTPTPTATATFTPTATATATATATFTPTPTATATATPTPTPCMLAAPSAQNATNVTFSSFAARWSSVSGATDYRLDVSTSNTFTTYVPGYQNLSVGNVTSFSVTGLSANTTYFYRVRAYNGCATSLNSNVKNVKTAACTPAAPSAQNATNVTSSSFIAHWSSVSGATDYRLDVSTSNTFTTYVPGYQNLSVGNVTSYSVTGLSANTTYYYRVRAYNGCATSLNSNVKNVKTKAH